ncbi:MAG: PGPGW domain-containing protein [Microthrixaceae bacterium]|nr:PGPGW domain-containing protein [Microthrixaceae bacterium]MCO5317983.1 PGPGW domain-containing protein [Microthrixaceae bacterium]
MADRPEHRLHLARARERLREAALEAERATGKHEETDEEATHSMAGRLLRGGAGFLLVGFGIALLPLPGPGWLVILLGLSMLPFAWARRTIRLIRRNVPGIPEDGRIPASTWVVMGLLVGAATVVTLLFGQQIGTWAGDTWESFWA